MVVVVLMMLLLMLLAAVSSSSSTATAIAAARTAPTSTSFRSPAKSVAVARRGPAAVVLVFVMARQCHDYVEEKTSLAVTAALRAAYLRSG